MNIDLRALVRMSTAIGGSGIHMPASKVYHCMLVRGEDAKPKGDDPIEGFDCRVPIPDDGYLAGGVYEIEIALLSPELALPHFPLGLPIAIWRGDVVAEGHIV